MFLQNVLLKVEKVGGLAATLKFSSTAVPVDT